MPITNYPNGFTNGVTVRGLPITLAHPGEVFWVNSSTVLPTGGVGGSDSGKGTYQRPFSTIDYAIGRCTASRGDIIMVMPGYTEDIAVASGITLDVPGVAIVGLGVGSLRPTITFSETASTIVISAANCSIINMVFEAAKAEVVTGISLTADADGTSFEAIESYEGAAAGTYNFVDFTTLATGANNLSWKDCKFIGKDASNDAFITGVAHQGFYVDNCYFAANIAQTAANGLIDSSGNITDMVITNSYFRSNIDGAKFIISGGAANSGHVVNCHFSSLDVAGAVAGGFDITGAHCFECYVAGEPDSFGIVGGGTVYGDGA